MKIITSASPRNMSSRASRPLRGFALLASIAARPANVLRRSNSGARFSVARVSGMNGGRSGKSGVGRGGALLRPAQEDPLLLDPDDSAPGRSRSSW
jgi:hypothetical protein